MGIYVIKMDQEQFAKLPTVFAELGFPKPRVTDRDGSVSYTFKFGLLRRLQADPFKPELTKQAYELWFPPTRAGRALFKGLRDRGYPDVRTWHESHRKSSFPGKKHG